MRRLIVALLLIVPFASDVALAQANAIDVVCVDCRDPMQHPDDYVNFAVNQVFGDDAWMTPSQADDFFVHNLKGDRVYVDIDFVMGGVRIFGNRLPIWPSNLVKITLALPDGRIYSAIRSVFQTSLPVPAPGSHNHDGGETGYDVDLICYESDHDDPSINIP